MAETKRPKGNKKKYRPLGSESLDRRFREQKPVPERYKLRMPKKKSVGARKRG